MEAETKHLLEKFLWVLVSPLLGLHVFFRIK